MNKKKEMLGILCTLSGGIMWGFSGSCGQYLFGTGMTSNYLVPLRMLSSGIILLIVSILFQRENFIGILKNKKDLLTAVLFGIFGIIISQYFYLAAIEHSNAGTATVLQYLGPAMIMIYICFKNRRLPTKTEAACLILAISGTFILATHGNFNSLSISPKALIFGLCAAAGLMLYSLIPEKIIPIYGALTVTGLGMTVGGSVLFLTMQPWKLSYSWNLPAAAAFAAIIVFGTVLAYTLYLKGVGLIGASKASVISCIEPVSAAVFSAVWLGTGFAAPDIIGFIFIIGTVIILSLAKQK